MLFISDWHFIIFKSGRMLQSNSLRSFGPCAVIQKFYMYFSFFNKVCVKKNVPVTTYDYDWVWYVCQKECPRDNLWLWLSLVCVSKKTSLWQPMPKKLSTEVHKAVDNLLKNADLVYILFLWKLNWRFRQIVSKNLIKM